MIQAKQVFAFGILLRAKFNGVNALKNTIIALERTGLLTTRLGAKREKDDYPVRGLAVCRTAAATAGGSKMPGDMAADPEGEADVGGEATPDAATVTTGVRGDG